MLKQKKYQVRDETFMSCKSLQRKGFGYAAFKTILVSFRSDCHTSWIGKSCKEQKSTKAAIKEKNKT